MALSSDQNWFQAPLCGAMGMVGGDGDAQEGDSCTHQEFWTQEAPLGPHLLLKTSRESTLCWL